MDSTTTRFLQGTVALHVGFNQRGYTCICAEATAGSLLPLLSDAVVEFLDTPHFVGNSACSQLHNHVVNYYRYTQVQNVGTRIPTMLALRKKSLDRFGTDMIFCTTTNKPQACEQYEQVVYHNFGGEKQSICQ
jgi:hypothetical protein